jgi:hypothetical protein
LFGVVHRSSLSCDWEHIPRLSSRQRSGLMPLLTMANGRRQADYRES